jgi:serpin B
MLYSGAVGETAAQMARTMHFTLPPDQLHPAFNSLSHDLSLRPAQSQKVDRKNPLQLYLANSIWGQRDYPFENTYLDLLAVNYGAGIRLEDFSAAPDRAQQQINDWVDQQTKGKIKDILPPGSLDPTTRMVLVNAIYFKAAWQEAFVEEFTHESPFTKLDGSKVQVPTMQTDGDIPLQAAIGNGFQAISLSYKGNLAEMIIILPDQGSFESVERTLDTEKFYFILAQLKPIHLTLYLPRFEFTADFDLIPILSELGMPLAFDKHDADFSAITKMERLYVYQAFHKAYILANEEGTEAAVTTIFGARPASLPQEFRIDRPFLFIIRDVPTGTILFVGRVLNPLDK